VMGLWILESCRREWLSDGIDVNYETLLGQIQALEDSPALIFPDEPSFLNPPSMLEAVKDQLSAGGWHGTFDPPILAKAILDSLALRYAAVLRTIEKLTGEKIRGVQIVGGGSRNSYLNQATANATGLPVLAGPAEATVTGNVVAQAVAAGRFSSLAEARQHVRQNIKLARFAPRPSSNWASAVRRYEEIEARHEMAEFLREA
jgi:rhamnulokinase